MGLPEGGDLTEVWWVPGSCGCHSCPGGASPCCGGSLSTGGGACAVAREIAISSYTKISPEPGFHPNAALPGVQGGWGGAARFRGPWTHQKGPLSVTLSPASGCRALLAFLGSSAFRGRPAVDTSPRGRAPGPETPGPRSSFLLTGAHVPGTREPSAVPGYSHPLSFPSPFLSP